MDYKRFRTLRVIKRIELIADELIFEPRTYELGSTYPLENTTSSHVTDHQIKAMVRSTNHVNIDVENSRRERRRVQIPLSAIDLNGSKEMPFAKDFKNRVYHGLNEHRHVLWFIMFLVTLVNFFFTLYMATHARH